MISAPICPHNFARTEPETAESAQERPSKRIKLDQCQKVNMDDASKVPEPSPSSTQRLEFALFHPLKTTQFQGILECLKIEGILKLLNLI